MASSSLQSLSSTLLSRSPLPPLVPKKAYDPSLSSSIDSLSSSTDILKAVLHLCNDDIEAAHGLAQAHEESMTANLTHAVLHRREGDFWNSKWWLSRIQHPTITSTHGSVKAAKKFVDDVERHEGSGRDASAEEGEKLKERQWTELKALLEYAMQEEEK